MSHLICRYCPGVIDNLPLPFRGAPPDREAWVLAQGFPFSLKKWREELPDPDMWPPELEAAPDSDREGLQTVDRRTVLGIGEQATEPLEAVRTLVAAAVWGTGTGARGRYRRCLALSQGVAVVGNVLAAAAQKLRVDGPLEAYAYLHGYIETASRISGRRSARSSSTSQVTAATTGTSSH